MVLQWSPLNDRLPTATTFLYCLLWSLYGGRPLYERIFNILLLVIVIFGPKVSSIRHDRSIRQTSSWLHAPSTNFDHYFGSYFSMFHTSSSYAKVNELVWICMLHPKKVPGFFDYSVHKSRCIWKRKNFYLKFFVAKNNRVEYRKMSNNQTKVLDFHFSNCLSYFIENLSLKIEENFKDLRGTMC